MFLLCCLVLRISYWILRLFQQWTIYCFSYSYSHPIQIERRVRNGNSIKHNGKTKTKFPWKRWKRCLWTIYCFLYSYSHPIHIERRVGNGNSIRLNGKTKTKYPWKRCLLFTIYCGICFGIFDIAGVRLDLPIIQIRFIFSDSIHISCITLYERTTCLIFLFLIPLARKLT